METRTHTIRSTTPLSVFVSSVMDEEMQSARDVCFDVLSADGYMPYLFERTPASPDTARQAYLEALKNADIVVWLAGSTTTEPVRLEVEQAREAGKPLLVYVTPAPARDESTSRLLQTVRSGPTGAKTSNVDSLDDLALQLRQAIDDLLVQALRRSGAPSQQIALGKLKSRLRDLAVSRWLTVGVSVRRAFEMFADPTIGSLDAESLPNAEHPLRVLVADVGAGKTLAAVRFLIEALERTVNDGEGAPFPIWIDAARVDHLADAIDAADPPDDYRDRGLVLVIDGLDEKGSLADSLLSEAMVLVNVVSSSRVLVTSRAGSTLRLAPHEQVSIPDLSMEESITLISRAFDTAVNAWTAAGWPAPIRDSLRRPLFALLMGRHVAEHGDALISGPGILIDELVSEAFGRTQVDIAAANRTLMQLAAKSIAGDGKPVPRTEFGDLAGLNEAALTRLIVEEASTFRFSMPILRDWFGAQCLLHKIVPLEEVVSSERMIERWRHALYVATTTLPREAVSGIMDAVTRKSPAFAAQVIDQGSRRRSSEAGDIALPTAIELGTHVRTAMLAFATGLGPLSPVVLPWPSGEVPPLGVTLHGDMFGLLWPDQGVDLANLPVMSEQGSGEPGSGWRWSLLCGAHPEPIWPWSYARDLLRDRLERRLRRLYVPGGLMERELAWATALELDGKGGHWYGPIPTDPLRSKLEQIPREAEWIYFGGSGRGRDLPLQPVRSALARGEAELVCPYPDRDESPGGWIWSGFSPERTLARAVGVYAAALAIYAELVDTYFVAFKSRLNTAQLLPLRLVGSLQVQLALKPESGATTPGMESQPVLHYYLEPLPKSANTEVEIVLDGPIPQWKKIGELQELARTRRPDTGPWAPFSLVSEGLDAYGPTPALSKAWDWLAEDLSAVGWLPGRSSTPW